MGLLEVVDEFLVLVSIVDREFEFAFFGPENDGLTFHAADHVEGRPGFAAQGQFQEVFLDASLNGLAQLGGDFEVAVGWAETFDALVRPLVIIIFDPEPDALPGRLEAFELGAREELLPDALPEALDLAQRHGVMRAGLEVVGPVLLHLGLEASGAPPVDVLPAIVGEHLLGRLVFGGGDAKHLQHVLGGVAAKQIGPHDESRVIIQETDEVGVTAPQPEGKDVGLPHLVGRGPLEEPGPDQVAPRLGRRLNQALCFEGFSHRLRASRQEEHPPQQLGDPFDAARGLLFFEFEDLVADGLRQLDAGPGRQPALQGLLTLPSISRRPLVNRGAANAQFPGDQLLGEALFEVKFDRAQPLLKGEAMSRHFWRSAPRGGGGLPLLLYWFILLHVTLLYH